MVGKAPSEGTKVAPGENAPVYREGAGAVAAGSLAAESVQAGGAFAHNRNIVHATPPSGEVPRGGGGGAAGGGQEPQGQAAPTYVHNVLSGGGGGGRPHGRNVTEDPGMTGRRAVGAEAQVGGAEDPGRRAERDMLLKQTRGAPGTGEREVGERGRDEQPFAALGRETSA